MTLVFQKYVKLQNADRIKECIDRPYCLGYALELNVEMKTAKIAETSERFLAHSAFQWYIRVSGIVMKTFCMWTKMNKESIIKGNKKGNLPEYDENILKLKNSPDHITLTEWRWWQCRDWAELSARFGAKFHNADVMVTNAPFDFCIFLWFRRHAKATPLMFKLYHWTFDLSVLRKATPRVFTLNHSTFDWSACILRKATPLVFTLNHSTFDWSAFISRKATPLVFSLYHSTFYWAMSRKATTLGVTLYHSTL